MLVQQTEQPGLVPTSILLEFTTPMSNVDKFELECCDTMNNSSVDVTVFTNDTFAVAPNC